MGIYVTGRFSLTLAFHFPFPNATGLRSRHREIQMINNQFGRSCPTIIRQQLPCPYHPCYEWRPSNWTECFLQVAFVFLYPLAISKSLSDCKYLLIETGENLQGAHCGTGVRHQLSECILAETRKRVDPEFCRLNRRSPLLHIAECKVLCTFGELLSFSIFISGLPLFSPRKC